MPLLWIGILVALPLLDIYATIRFAEALNVPGWALFVPGFVFGIGVLRLVRVSIGQVVLGDLAKGAWRPLTEVEVAALGGG